ncbi:hypothetical protein C8046_13045 [Serinibacter arcticus]|uniref:Uncharacterized protein n=1 Tax=Serinibacter arcticus TaxID=1655435 RepID=A0A2U1ZWT5_9MICO|nr:hypothetical protein [Serinibacter arcticus]PWD51445.1 hypothetical protein C8046_13045 [Serinibacter arcticus]
MFNDFRRRRAARRVKAGDGHALQRYRWWQPLSRALLHLPLRDDDGTEHRWSVDVRLWGDDNGDVIGQLYRDDVNVNRSTLPATFDVPGGVIEVAASGFGMRRCHFVGVGGVERQLVPDPASAEGRRARLEQNRPGLSRAIGIVSVLVLLVALALGIPQTVEQITRIPPVAEHLGTFVSPIHLAGWANITLAVAALIASSERALRLRYHWLLDGGLFDGDD